MFTLSFDIQKRFWSNVLIPINDIYSCWNWIGLKDKNGYGKIKINKKTVRPHRIVYQLYTGLTLDPTSLICHTCDNPACVNILHLFVGTAKDNYDDMASKGRSIIGEKSPNHKLVEDDIIKIFDLFINHNFNPVDLAVLFNISETSIVTILKRNSWKHINIPFLYNPDNDYTYLINKNKKDSLQNGKRLCFRKRFKDFPEIYDEIHQMLVNSIPKSDICNKYDINYRTLTRLIRNGKV